jgi:cell division FtsZ-interacting protein ZapD
MHWFPRITNRLERLRSDDQQSDCASVRDAHRTISELLDIVAELAQAVAEMQKTDAQEAR